MKRSTSALIGLGVLVSLWWVVNRSTAKASENGVVENPIASAPTFNTSGTFTPENAERVADAYLTRPLANDALLEQYSGQGMGVGNYATYSLLGSKYVNIMNTDSYQSIYGRV